MSRNSPAQIVAPERETPGTSATACAKPMITASTHVSAPRPRRRRPTASAARKTALNGMSIDATSAGDRNACLTGFSSSSPITAAGIVPSTMIQARRPSGSRNERSCIVRKPPKKSRTHVMPKKTSSASSVPRCSAVSNYSP